MALPRLTLLQLLLLLLLLVWLPLLRLQLLAHDLTLHTGCICARPLLLLLLLLLLLGLCHDHVNQRIHHLHKRGRHHARARLLAAARLPLLRALRGCRPSCRLLLAARTPPAAAPCPKSIQSCPGYGVGGCGGGGGGVRGACVGRRWRLLLLLRLC